MLPKFLKPTVMKKAKVTAATVVVIAAFIKMRRQPGAK
jgi:hypothetical protein